MSETPNTDWLEQKNNCAWYENLDGTCKLHEPTLLNLGDERPFHLLFPTHWKESLSVLALAKDLANELDAQLVLMLYGELSDNEMKKLILALIVQQVIPLWIGDSNHKKFNKAITSLSSFKL